MFCEEGHPDVTLSDWAAFKKGFSPFVIEEVIDRSAIKLLDRFLPLARGVVIASPHLLNTAGYRIGSRRPPGWSKPHCDVFQKDIRADNLLVRGYHGHPFWHVERNGPPARPHSHRNMTLVHNFGSTPVVTRTYQAAAYLAEYSYHNDPPGGLRWVNECPDDIRGAIEFAEQRRVDEAIAAIFLSCTRDSRGQPVRQ